MGKSLYEDALEQALARDDWVAHMIFDPKNTTPAKFSFTYPERLKKVGVHEILRNYLGDGDVAIDIGVSTGVTTIDLKRDFPKCRFIGTETHAISLKTAIRVAKNRGVDIEFLDYDFGDAKAPPFKNVNCVICANLICWLDSDRRENLFKNAFKALEEGGIFLLVFEAWAELYRKTDNSFQLLHVYEDGNIRA